MEQTAFPHLQKQQYMSLTTFRKNGEPDATPVWVTGAAQEATVRIMDSVEGQFALDSLNRKYGLSKRIYDMMLDFLRWVQRRPAANILYLEIKSA
jgi:hypothetical protein